MPVRALYRYALERDEVQINPTTGLRMPNGLGRRDRVASPSEAAKLLAALPEDLRPLYATAAFAGLRRGELRGLKWDDVDLAAGLIHVRRSWDDKVGAIEPKSQKGKRIVPVTGVVRDYLVEQKTRTGGDGSAFVFPGRGNSHPFTPTWIRRRANRAWAAANAAETKKAEEEGRKPRLLNPIALHSCRHTFVTLMSEAGVSLEEIGDLVGHSSTYMTDRYRHLREDRRTEAARKFDEYLARADTAGRTEQLDD
jgi:integrase